MYYYKSLSDMHKCLEYNVHRLPRDIDCIVGIPRSGLLAANMLALILNLPVTDFEGFLQGRLIKAGSTRALKNKISRKWQPTSVLIIDDSILSGRSFAQARQIIPKNKNVKITFAAVYGRFSWHQEVDMVFEKVPTPRMFQWNYMHHPNLEKCCVDIDGVLCHDPKQYENDDGPAYKKFLLTAKPLNIPTYKIGNIVTSRLEKYRAETEKWLSEHSIKYNKLFMLGVESAEERRKKNMHGSFKASIYKKTESNLFIESDINQSVVIAKMTKRPVLSVDKHIIIYPSHKTIVFNTIYHTNLLYDFKNIVKMFLKQKFLFAYKLYSFLKKPHSFK